MRSRSEKSTLAAAFIVSTCATAASAYLYQSLTQNRWAYLSCIAVTIVAWALRQLAQASRRSDITKGIVFAGLLLTVALATRMDFSAEAPWLRTRAVGFLTGAVLVIFANAIPKQAGNAPALAIRRLVGWSLVLAGIAYALSWMILPLHLAAAAGIAALLLAFALAIIGAWRITLKHRPNTPSGSV